MYTRGPTPSGRTNEDARRIVLVVSPLVGHAAQDDEGLYRTYLKSRSMLWIPEQDRGLQACSVVLGHMRIRDNTESIICGPGQRSARPSQVKYYILITSMWVRVDIWTEAVWMNDTVAGIFE